MYVKFQHLAPLTKMGEPKSHFRVQVSARKTPEVLMLRKVDAFSFRGSILSIHLLVELKRASARARSQYISSGLDKAHACTFKSPQAYFQARWARNKRIMTF